MYWSHAAHAGTNTPGGLVLVALAHAFALFAAVSAAINVSGGHVNPAVTFGALIGGRLSAIRAIYYWIAQLLGAILACLLLRLATNGMVPLNKIIVHQLVYIYELVFLCCNVINIVHLNAETSWLQFSIRC